ncbi:2-succinyl-5-enolpyruvyl-6-hydroxy-3-cyclohexene-1-carboxylic-acid synthase [Subtercola frigoramans]|uniref:2-succinyl-5-enolpyruvyl-6-hydroxy-3-cyclohexene-1-carboxylate synthase n=1 Tax=Subtercola frigoramans TaxID=120298 RepID=A0ABS2L1N6_9MICO|nr:2-succinyl-5-enolpyruvyl-6-hydroxy-3-cyclohexene-1-carboxylic-acid synthase [Subtercola frigoramans]MBM7470987.1 2-succinyl-5-enolpyruvyl-6-hydroxy-3-cyclohexene-1-carboxylate synthase [Subtercola frigoramans]
MTAAHISTGSPAADFSLALLQEFHRLGVTDAVLSPGSRSQGLALALAEFDRASLIDLQVRIDERTSGFTALGLAVETGQPALVVTTSGTAVANLLPAVLEASHSSVPMLVLSSDRPAELRGTGGNQTTWQPGIFGRFVRHTIDVGAPSGRAGEPSRAITIAREAYEAAVGMHSGRPGPVHVNLQFREPLSASVPDLVSNPLAFAGGPSQAGEIAQGKEPSGDADHSDRQTTARDAPSAALLAPLELARGPRTIVIAGHGGGRAAEQLAHEGGWPLVAEPSSGSRFGRNLVVAYRELLNDPDFGGRVERAIVFGHPTLSREVPVLSLREGVETIVVTPDASAHLAAAEEFTRARHDASAGENVDPRAVFRRRAVTDDAIGLYNPGHRVSQFATTVTVATDPTAGGSIPSSGTPSAGGTAPDDRDWLRSWVLANRAIVASQLDEVAPPNPDDARSPDIAVRRDYRLAELAALRAPITRRVLALALWQATWPHDRLVLGASRLIRDLDRVVPGKNIRVHSNRGLAGIDGTIATAIGIALASQRGPDSVGVTRLLLGDLTLLHDVGSMLLGVGERRPRIQLVVANDGGGTIFDTLEVADTASRAAFDRVMFTPQAVDIASLAKAYGWAYSSVTTRTELDSALTAPVSGPAIVEVRLPR